MTKLSGRELYNNIGKPKKIVAPMVDQSELAWRIISRKYGADLCYSPMYHAKLFAHEPAYRQKMMGKLDGDPSIDRPLIIQFCANDPEILLQAASFVEDRCDAVDLNLGCPQGIARKGHYGSFLMEDWDLIYRLINTLHTKLKIPVTTKIRIYEDWTKTLEYAKMVISAGAQFLTVHGRTRDMKGQQSGLANWDVLQDLRLQLRQQVFFANGNIVYPEDIDRCFETIKCDAVMSAEGNLYNPGTFWTENNDKNKTYPRVDFVLREYFEIVRQVSDKSEASKHSMKSHFFKILHEFLNHHKDLRPLIGKTSVNSDFQEWDNIVKEIELRVQKIFQQENIKDIDIIVAGKQEAWGGRYMQIPFWRCQPYFRRVDGEKVNTKYLKVAASLDFPSKYLTINNDIEREEKRQGESESIVALKKVKVDV